MATAKKSAPSPASSRAQPVKKAAPAKAPVRQTASSKAAPKAAAKSPAKPVAAPAPAPAAVTRSIPTTKQAKPEKPKKPKLVRDSFTIPKAEYTVLDTLKQRAAKAGLSAKKSEVLRAGIKALAALSDAAFAAAMAAVPPVKTGRPAKD
ncbi:MAG: hypothetical protein EOO25_09750 [Comamonadaceae bacterium]|nr:MAG: hypothetical protein EOO25_09750 [Comamonadaceae bacterium]